MNDALSYPAPYATPIAQLDAALMASYAFARRNARRIAQLVLTLAPLLALLVGSCQTARTHALSALAADGPSRFRAALFPVRAGHEAPAAGYVSIARRFVENKPAALEMLTRAEIGYIFGQPDLRRRDGDADIWQYKAGACVVNLYFYGGSALAHIDVNVKSRDDAFRATPVSAHERRNCLRSIDAPGFKSADL